MKNRYCPIEETSNLEKTLSEVPDGYELHSVVYMSYFNYAHHYTVIWQKTGHDFSEPEAPTIVRQTDCTCDDPFHIGACED